MSIRRLRDAIGPAPVESRDDLLLPRPPGVVRRFWGRHVLLADILVATVGLLGAYLEAIDNGRGFARLDYAVGGLVVLVVVAAAGLMVRRRHPLVALGIVTGCSLLLAGVGDGIALITPLVIAVYSVAVYASSLRAWWSAAVVVALVVAVALLRHKPVEGHALLAFVLVVVLLIGSNLGNRRRYLAALIDRAAQLTRERDQQAQIATASERARIAREMHDIVAHSLSVMVRLSDGAQAVVASEPERSQQAVRQIGAVGRDALAEMRRLLGVLRDDEHPEGGLSPQPSLADLDDLVTTYRSAGLPVAVQRIGEAPAAEGLQVVVYRAVQEALTNALRYSKNPTRVLVKIDYGNGIEVDVSDDGTGATEGDEPAASVGSGRGLLGLRERAALYGGTVEAGPRRAPDHPGWRTRVTLPPLTGGTP